jgi:all-trans-8'-apo-beta-carotenal 15,15'-oxygenase
MHHTCFASFFLQGFQKERRAGKALYPGQFGNPKPFWSGGLKTKNVANTNVVFWAGRLLALWEGGQPYKLDPLSLGTAGATDLSACVPPGKSLAAHPRLDAATGRLVAFSYVPNPLTGTALRILEFDENFKLARPILEHNVSACDDELEETQLTLLFFASE